MFLIDVIVEDRCGTGRLGVVELPIDTKPVAVIGVGRRGTIQTETCIEEGFGGAVLRGKTTAFPPAEEAGTRYVAGHTAETKISSHQEDLFFGKHRQVLAPRLTDQMSQHETKHGNVTRPATQ